jgi:pimeloyl-ACP methyl ester carboxylesterase
MIGPFHVILPPHRGRTKVKLTGFTAHTDIRKFIEKMPHIRFRQINKNSGWLLIVTSLWLSSSVTAAKLRVPNAITTPIQETRFVTLGGVEQWVTIRGANRANPVLLVVHGGPGDAQSSLRTTYAVYEKDFTIVQWDQRGAGKTYARNPDSPPEPERVELDGVELAQYLCNYLAKKKILVLGHSWGTYLAIGMVQRRPQLFAAYIGTGQVGSWRANIQAQFDFLLAKARAANDRKRVEQLQAIGKPDPNNAEQYFSWWSMRNPYMSPDDARWFAELREIARSNPDFTEAYLKTLGDGMIYSGRTTLSAMLATELPTTANTLRVPFFVIQGAEDMVTPTSVAVQYFNIVKAPRKKLIIIAHAGHFALVTHREEFLAALVRHVRPLAVKSEGRSRRAR